VLLANYTYCICRLEGPAKADPSNLEEALAILNKLETKYDNLVVFINDLLNSIKNLSISKEQPIESSNSGILLDRHKETVESKMALLQKEPNIAVRINTADNILLDLEKRNEEAIQRIFNLEKQVDFLKNFN